MQVRIEQLDAEHPFGRWDHAQCRARDDTELSQPAARDVEEVRVEVRRTGKLAAVSGHHIQIEDIVRLHAVTGRGPADAAHSKRAAN